MYRKSIAAFIINDKKEFLLVNLTGFKESCFAIPGGGLEINETLKEAAYREIKEELNIGKELLEFITSSDIPVRFNFKEKKTFPDGNTYDGQERNFFAFNFLGNDADIKIEEKEIRKYLWCKYEDMKNYLFFDDQLKDVQDKIKEMKLNIL